MKTAHKTEEEKKEYIDSMEELANKVKVLASLIKSSKHVVVFTGAGISTSTGIPDFRSGTDTILPTGPGAWEKRKKKHKEKPYVYIPSEKAKPSYTHMAILELYKKGHVKHLISQNADGVHMKSGFPRSKMSELHGNTSIEKCSKCGKEYLRDFYVEGDEDHLTGYVCEKPGCTGALIDTIINFGEDLPESQLKRAFQNSKACDLFISIGSSLRVTPACDMPLKAKKHGAKVVIINLQKTPVDDKADLVIHGLCDNVMKAVMDAIGIPVEPFKLRRRIAVNFKKTEKGTKILVEGMECSGEKMSILTKVVFRLGTVTKTLKKEPYEIVLAREKKCKEVKLVAEFYGNHNEPVLNLAVPYKDEGKCVYEIEYDLKKPEWQVQELTKH